MVIERQNSLIVRYRRPQHFTHKIDWKFAMLAPIIPDNHMGQTSTGMDNGIFAVIYPRDMSESDAEFVLDMLGHEARRVRRRQENKRTAEALAFSWAGDASTC